MNQNEDIREMKKGNMNSASSEKDATRKGITTPGSYRVLRTFIGYAN